MRARDGSAYCNRDRNPPHAQPMPVVGMPSTVLKARFDSLADWMEVGRPRLERLETVEGSVFIGLSQLGSVDPARCRTDTGVENA